MEKEKDSIGEFLRKMGMKDQQATRTIDLYQKGGSSIT